ncbi:MAG: hypothetical protein WC728_18015 [Elusimicrobiota bacterium]
MRSTLLFLIVLSLPYAPASAAVMTTVIERKVVKGEAPSPSWTAVIQDKDGKPVQVDPALLRGSDREVLGRLLQESFKKVGGMQGMSPDWKMDQDSFFKALQEDPRFKDGKKTFVVEKGVFIGISVEHEGKTYLYKPGDTFAFQTKEAGKPVQPRVLKLENGTLSKEPHEIGKLSREEQQALRGVVDKNLAFSKGAGTQAGSLWSFDGMLVSGSEPVPGTKAAPPVSPEAAPEAKAHLTPPEKGFSIVNEYGGKDTKAPEKLKKDDLYWEGADLKQVTGVDKDGKVESKAVGYMSKMEGEHAGMMVFWHGGAGPDKQGAHADAKQAWALFYLPKPEGKFEVEDGHTTAKFIQLYHMIDLKGAKEVDTPEGKRIELWTALSPSKVYSKETKTSKYEPLFEGKEQLLFKYGAPQGKEQEFQNYVGMDGFMYKSEKVQVEVNGEKVEQTYLVRTGRLFNVKPPAAPETPTPAPAQETAPPPQKPGTPPATATSPAKTKDKWVALAEQINADPKRAIGMNDAVNLLLYLDRSKDQTDVLGRTAVAKALVQAYERNKRSFWWNSSETNKLYDGVAKKFAAELKGASSAGDDYNYLQAMAQGLVQLKASDRMKEVLGSKLSAGRILMADEARKAGVETEGVKAACLEILNPANAKTVKELLGTHGDIHRTYAARGLVKAYAVKDLADLVDADSKKEAGKRDPDLLRHALDGLSWHSDYIPGPQWWGSPHERRAAALVILKAAVASGDASARARAIDIGRLMKFKDAELGA